jgi:hypothetical protein
LPLFDDQLAGQVATVVLPTRLKLALTPSDSLDAVKDKERALSQLAAPGGVLARWSMAANAWCAATLSSGPSPSSGLVAEWIAAATGGSTTLPTAQLHRSIARANALAQRHSTFHGASPEALRGDQLGRRQFDAIIGNLPGTWWGRYRQRHERRDARITAASCGLPATRVYA